MSVKSLVVTQNVKPADYAYPAGTHVEVLQHDGGEVHRIYGPDANPTTNYTKAPNGSVYIPMTGTAADQKIWVKFGATFGATDGTWKATAALT